MHKTRYVAKLLLSVCETFSKYADAPSTRHPVVVKADSASMPRLPM